MRHALIAAALLVILAPRLAAQGAPPPKEGTISINFDGMDLDRILKMVSDELQVRFLYDDKVLKRKVNVLSPVDIPREHLLSVLQSILEQQGFTMVRAGTPEAEVWKIVPFTQPICGPCNGRIKTYVMDDTDKLPQGEELSSLAIHLDHVDARSAFIAVQGMASDPRMVQAIETANLVIVTDTAPNLRRIAELVRIMDVPGHGDGEPSVSVETCIFDVRAETLASRGLRIAGSKEGTELSQADAAALRSDLLAAATSDDIRLLHRWSGRVMAGTLIRSEEQSKAVRIEVTLTPHLPRRPGRTAPPAEGQAPPPAAPIDGEVSLAVSLALETGSAAGATRHSETTTLGGREGDWLLWSIDSAVSEGRVRLFFARVAR